MNNISHRIEQHIREHESRLMHIDELIARVRAGAGELPEYAEVHTKLDELATEREKHAVRLDDLRSKAAEEWQEEEIEKSGLMGIWDALAQQLEKLVERVER